MSKKGWKNQYGASKGGRKYWENRENRSDRKSPDYETGKPYLEKGGNVEFKNSIRSSQGNYTYNLTFQPTNNISELYIEDSDGKKSARFNDIYFSIVEGFAREFEYLMDEYEDEFTQTDWSFDGEVKSAYHNDKKYGASSEKGIFTIFIGDESYKFESEELIQDLAESFVEL